jgi:hypothetical protein
MPAQLALVRRLSEKQENTVIGLYRTPPNADSIADITSRDNLHWVEADIGKRELVNVRNPRFQVC